MSCSALMFMCQLRDITALLLFTQITKFITGACTLIQVATYELKAYKSLSQLVHEHCTLLKLHAQERKQDYSYARHALHKYVRQQTAGILHCC